MIQSMVILIIAASLLVQVSTAGESSEVKTETGASSAPIIDSSTPQFAWHGVAPSCGDPICVTPLTHLWYHSISGDGAECGSGHKILCASYPKASYSNLKWYGTAPYCDGSCPSGYQSLVNSTSGDGAICFTDHKILCGIPVTATN